MAVYDSIDCLWSWDGDYGKDQLGDLADTSEDFLNSIVQEVQTFVKSETLDWEKDITVATDLSDFQGVANTRENGKAIEERVKSRLVNHNLVQPGDISVRVVPVHNNQVMIMVRISAQPTSKNGLSPGEPIKVDFIYDTVENGIFFLADNITARNMR